MANGTEEKTPSPQKCTEPFPLDMRQKCQKHMMGKRQPLQEIILGKLDTCRQKAEITSISFTLYKYQLKVS
jgi:hypothetical protein